MFCPIVDLKANSERIFSMFYSVKMLGKTIYLVNSKFLAGYVSLHIAVALTGVATALELNNGSNIYELKVILVTYLVSIACLFGVIFGEFITRTPQQSSYEQVKESSFFSLFGSSFTILNAVIFLLVLLQGISALH